MIPASSSSRHRRDRRTRSGGALRSGTGARAPRACAALVLALALAPSQARADLRICNMTPSKVGVAVGYRDSQGWVTEGWWNLTARGCETLLKGDLAARFYYFYALDYGPGGGEWTGRSFMCTRDREFTIRGVEDCLARGFDRSGFFEVDTGEQKSWTIQLADPSRVGAPLQ
jgi:uncharacterized membrane protein